MKSVFYFAFLSMLVAGCTTDRPSNSGVSYGDQPVNPPAYEPGTVSRPMQPIVGIATASRLQQIADDNLVASVRREFNRYGELAALSPNVEIAAHNGVVTVSGRVPTDREKDMIASLLKDTPGVVQVNNLLVASTPVTAAVPPTGVETSRVYPKPSGDIFNLHLQDVTDTDMVIAQRVVEALRNDTSLRSPAPRVDIFVANGKVTLQGDVASEQQREKILSIARGAAGVNNVRDDLRVP